MTFRVAFLTLAISCLTGIGAGSGASSEQREERIAFATNRAPNLWRAAVYTIRPEGRRRRLLGRGVPGTTSAQVTVSPNGRHIVYGEGTLFIAGSDGSHPRRLTPTNLEVSGGLFSPDGKRVAFSGGPPCDEVCKPKVYIVRVDGTGLHSLGRGVQPAWAPDSRHLAFAAGPRPFVYVANLRRPLRRLARGGYPAWAPNGRRIAYRQEPEGTLCFVNTDGSVRRCVADQVGNSATAPEIAWSPNGAKVAFVGEGLRVVGATGAGVRRLTDDLEDRSLTWSPDSSQLAFVRMQEQPDRAEHQQIYAISVAGRRATRRVTAEPIPTRVSSLRWTRSGIRYVAELTKNDLELAVMKPGGGDLRILTHNRADDLHPSWSPDRRTIAFSREGALRLIDPDGTRDRALTAGDSFDGNPAWSPDGTRIAFVRRADAYDVTGQLMVIRVSDGRTTTLVIDPPPAPGRISWSPNGRSIAFASGHALPRGGADLFVVNADGSGLRLLETDLASALSPTWSPDGTRIAFSGEGGQSGLLTIRPDGSGRTLVVHKSHPPDGASWSPAGDRLVFEEYPCSRECGVGGRIVSVPAGGGGRRALTPGTSTNAYPAWGT